MTLISRVSAIVQDVAATIIMPSFRSLRPEDIHVKYTVGDPDDLVTVIDRAAERYLIDALKDVVPGAAFIGEEASADDPSLLNVLSSLAPAWLIDPVDGTKNFAGGHADFGVMIALIEKGRTRASWIAVPAGEPSPYLVVAEEGNGTHINGLRVTLRHDVPPLPRGSIHTRMMPSEDGRRVLEKMGSRYESRPSTGSAATEYSAILRGEKDFVIYYRLLPWDHAPGALAITEAGGAAVHVSGVPYTPLSPNQVTIFAATPALADTIRAWLT